MKVINIIKNKLKQKTKMKRFCKQLERYNNWYSNLTIEEKIDFLEGFFCDVTEDNYDEKWREFLQGGRP